MGWRALAVLVLGVASVLTLTYPYAAQWVEAGQQAAASQNWEAAVHHTGADVLEAQREEADLYNEALALNTINSVNYWDTLGLPTSDAMGKLVIPKIDLDQPIRHGMKEYALVNGIGHAEQSSLPVGGESTHAVLGGHRGMAQSIGFTRLPELVIGDEFQVHSLGEIMTYRVIETETLEPLDAAIHPVEQGRDLVTLLTCTPMGINSHRFVVTAERIENPKLATPEVDLPGFPWWAVWSAGGLAVVAGVTVILARSHRKLRNGEETDPHKTQELQQS